MTSQFQWTGVAPDVFRSKTKQAAVEMPAIIFAMYFQCSLWGLIQEVTKARLVAGKNHACIECFKIYMTT
jgi:hypothetical protein